MSSNHIASVLLALALTPAAAAAQEPALTIDLGDGVKLELVLVKKGEFEQGSPADEAGRGADETARQVTISRDFYMGKSPVTRGQFARFVRESSYRTEAEQGTSGGYGFDGTGLVQRKEFTWRNPGFTQTDEHPVCLVTYDDARAFTAWLSKKAGRTIDLPTEAQWEFACRAGSTTPYYNGASDLEADEIAWFKSNSGNGTRPVGQKKPNGLGLHDLCGNVYEWCRDWYGPYEAGPATDPDETRSDRSDKPRRVLRGGSWLKESRHCRSAARFRNAPGSRNADNGFRVVAAVAAPAPGGAAPQPPSSSGVAGSASTQPAPQQVPVPSPGPAPSISTVPPAQPAPARVERQPASPARPAAAPASTGSFTFLGTLCFGLVLIAVIGLVVIVIKRLTRPRAFGDFTDASFRDPGAQPFPRQPPQWQTRAVPRIVADGFWLDTSDLDVGSVVRYGCRVNNQEQSGQVTVESVTKALFIYTGGTPSAIDILEIIPSTGGVFPTDPNAGLDEPARFGATLPPRRPPPAPKPSTRPSAPPSTGYPSAY
jgi:formylglycine-generating enzyme required for sulfatase activity